MTYIGSAEVRMENTGRRDRLVKAAQDAGFVVKCSEAFGVSLSGNVGPEHWYIRVLVPGDLSLVEQRAFRVKLAEAWKGL